MNFEDYRREVLAAAVAYIDAHYDWNTEAGYWQRESNVVCDVFGADEVTGNQDGTFTHDADKAAENVAGVLFDPVALRNLMECSQYDHWPIEEGPEACDVLARCAAVNSLWDKIADYWRRVRAFKN